MTHTNYRSNVSFYFKPCYTTLSKAYQAGLIRSCILGLPIVYTWEHGRVRVMPVVTHQLEPNRG